MKQLTLQEAIEILEIMDLDSLTENDLNKIKRKASKKWHPDRIAAMKSGEEVVNTYKENFQKVAPAIEIIRAYINGEDYTDMSANANINKESSVDIIKKEIPNIRAFFKEHWEAIKDSGYKKTVEKQLLFNGFGVYEVLKEDLQYQLPKVAIINMTSGTFLPSLLGLFFLETPAIALLIYAFTSIQVLCSLIFLFPVGRFLLPQFIQDIIMVIMDIGVYMHNLLIEIADFLPRNISWFMHLILGLITFFGKVIQWFIIAPIYHIVGSIFSDVRIGKVEREFVFYSGFTADYIEELLVVPIDRLTDDEIYNIGHIYSKLGNFKPTLND